MPSDFPELRVELANRVLARTGRQVRNLDVELLPEGVVLHGQAMSYYAKQLAQQSIRELLPHVQLDNAIQVGS
jgi:hypothetical protein